MKGVALRLWQRRALAVLAAALTSLAWGPASSAPADKVLGGPFPPGQPEAWRLPAADLYGVDARGDRVWAVGYWGAVLLSTDGGESWTHAPTPTRDTLYAVSFADDRHGWAVGALGALLRSRDGGATWEAESARFVDEFGDERTVDVHLFGVSAVSAEEAWAVGDFGLVLRRGRGGWQQVRIPEESYADDNFPDRIFNGVDFPDPQHGWITGEFGTTLRTRDGGQTWVGERQLVDTPEDIYFYAISAIDEQRAAVSGLAGSVLLTDDGGATWQPMRTGSSAGLFGVMRSPERAFAVGDRGEMFLLQDGQAAWRQPDRPRLFNWLTAVAEGSRGLVFAVGEKGLILRSRDGGESWKQVAGAKPPPLSGVSVPPEPGTIVEPRRRDSRGLPRQQPEP